MKSLRTLLLIACVAFWGIYWTPKADAGEWNQKTVISFDQPVELPGIVLPAGTYIFKLLQSPVDRDLVQVLSQDERTVFATIKTIPTYRANAPSENLIVYADRPAGAPRAIKEWFFPDRRYGHEFVYPKTESRQMARADESANNSFPGEYAERQTEQAASNEMTEPEESNYLQLLKQQQSGEPDVTVNYSDPVMDSERTDYSELLQQKQGVPRELAKSDEPESADSAQQAGEASSAKIGNMPRTASPLPLVGISGILLLAAGSGLRLYSRRTN